MCLSHQKHVEQAEIILIVPKQDTAKLGNMKPNEYLYSISIKMKTMMLC